MKKLRKFINIKSFRIKLLLLIIFVWLIPISLITSYIYMNFVKDIKSNINENFINTVVYSIEIPTNDRLEKVISASRKASYDKIIEDRYKDYLAGKIDSRVFFTHAYTYLKVNYYNEKEIQMVSLELDGLNNKIYLDSGRHLYDYEKNVRNKILLMTDEIDTYVGFYADENDDLFVFRNLMVSGGEKGRKKIGTLVLKIDKDYMFKEVLRKNWGDVIISINNCILPIKTSEEESNRSRYAFLNNQGFFSEEDNTSYVGKSKKSDYLLKYYVSVDNNLLYSSISKFRNYLITVLIVLFPLIIFLVNFLYRNLTNPLKELSNGINDIQLGKLGIQVDSKEQNEFEYLFDAFNSMSNRLFELFEKVYRKEVAAKDAKIMSLRSQINPHFINNTLELMNWQARLGDTDGVSKMIDSLSIMLDAAMNRESKVMSVLSLEIEYCDAYLYVISQRYKDKLEIIKEIENNLMDYMVPSLIIQPLLENAIKHGIEPVGRGFIKLAIKKEKTALIIEVSNNGKSLSKEDEEKIHKLLNYNEPLYSLGIRNVNERLNLMFDGESYLKIYSENNITIAKMTLPLKEKRSIEQ